MSEPADPVTVERRRVARRRADAPPPPQVEGERANLPAVVAAPAKERPHDRSGAARREGAPSYAAQMMGQEGQKRGLRGGAPVLNQARSAYLATEYSGPRDRRPPRGRVAKTEI